MKPLAQFLSDRRTSDSKKANVRGLGLQKGNYFIHSKDYDSFLDSFHEYVFDEGHAANLIEVHREFSPILIDLDFRYPSGGPLERRFTNEEIYNFIDEYAKILCRFFPIESLEEPLRFIIQTKPAPEKAEKNDEPIHKDGIHIICPDVSISSKNQYALRGYILEQKIVEKCFGNEPINPAGEIFDRAVIASNGWFLYGACKPEKQRYKNIKMYLLEASSQNNSRLSPETLDSYTNREFIGLLSIRRNHTEENFCDVRPEMEDEWYRLATKWSAPERTVRPAKALNHFATEQGETDSSKMANQEEAISVRSAYTKEDIKKAFDLARECLNPETRARDYHKWVELALVLRNIEDSEEALRTWMHISRKVAGYEHTVESDFANKWTSLCQSQVESAKQIKMGTLYHWVKQDNPKKYEVIRDRDVIDYAYNHENGSHVEIANLILRCYRHEYRCAPNMKSYDWYQYENHCWKPVKQPMELRASISNRIRDIYTKAVSMAIDKELATEGDDAKKILQERQKKLNKVKANLENSGFKDSVMKEVTEKFYQEDFREQLDSDTCLVGVGNGVLVLNYYDADSGKTIVHFREGKPDDFISLQIGKFKNMPAINYVPYDASNPQVKEIMDFFNKLFPQPELREYVLTLLSACLEGKNREQRFYIFQGEGSNGKSAIIRFIEMVFGEYQVQTQATLITRKQNDSGAAAPQMVAMRNKRFVHMQEPEEGEKINSSLMKQLSGEDMFSARGLYKDQENFTITARLFLCCNRFPPVNSIDNGTWRRLRVIKFISEFRDADRFKDAADEREQAKKNIFKKEPSIETSDTYGFKAWRQTMLGLMVHYYEAEYLVHGLREPACIKEESEKYKADNDSFASFMQDRLVAEIGSETTLKEISTSYKDWLQSEPDKKKLSPADIRQKLIDRFGKPVTRSHREKDVFRGVRIAGESEDISGNVVSENETVEAQDANVVTAPKSARNKKA
jgi:P4 family phage/plasmid primase-like protien